MFLYSRTYRSLPPVADPDARQRLMHAAAPPILGGTPLDDDLLFGARSGAPTARSRSATRDRDASRSVRGRDPRTRDPGRARGSGVPGHNCCRSHTCHEPAVILVIKNLETISSFIRQFDLNSTTRAPMYAKTYPSLHPVADPAARQRLLHSTAPPILAGTPVDEELLFSATMERQLREVEAQRGMVTRHEVLAAMIREHAIMAEHAVIEYPTTFAAVVPPGVSL
ncbi:hypothetical protein PRNP1_005061 [Phytophthora ramorum]